MDLMPGYKHTEVGVIPEDWEIADLESITDSKRTISYGIVQTGPNIPNGVRCLRVVDVNNGQIDRSNLITTSQSISDSYSRTILKVGDLVMPLRGKVGEVAIVDEELSGCNLTRGVALIAIRSDWSAPFCLQFIASVATRTRLEQSMNGSALQEIPIATLRSFKIALPPNKAEQEAIAEALSHADALIASLEKLIAKKRHLKQGVMQELLTGKKRLPGFNEEWETKPLRELCSAINDGTHFTPQYVESGIPFYSVENVTANNFTDTKFISPKEHSQLIKRCRPEIGDILLTRIGALGDTRLIDWEVDASIYVSLALLKVRADVDSRYLYCYTKCRKFVEDIEARSLMNASPKKINMGDIGGVPILVPPLPEQTAIAAVLIDMDAESAALEAKLAKARQIKQGMMHNLLTGRIRLV